MREPKKTMPEVGAAITAIIFIAILNFVILAGTVIGLLFLVKWLFF